MALTREATVLGNPDGISLGRTPEAIALLKKSLEITEDIAARDPGESDSRQQIATVGRLLAELVRDDDPAGALAVYDQVLRHAGEVKNNTIARLNEASALAGSSYPLRALHREPEARARLDAAFAKLAELKRYPGVPIKAGTEAEDALSALADDEAARGNMTRAVDIYQKLVEQVLASGPKPETDLADATAVSRLYASLARLERRAGRPADAAALDARRSQIWQRWEKALPGSPFVARQLASVDQLLR